MYVSMPNIEKSWQNLFITVRELISWQVKGILEYSSNMVIMYIFLVVDDKGGFIFTHTHTLSNLVSFF